MHILGISCYYHESSACLLKDGIVVAASAEERFTRKKHDAGFPKEAVKFCLRQANISVEQVDYVVFYEKPFWKFQRILLSSLATYPSSSQLFAKGMINWFTEKLWVRSTISEELKIDRKKILFVPHHISHAASAFYPSGFDDAAILTMDGVGEWTTTAIGVGDGTKIEIIEEMRFPHSLGLLYSVFTAFLGFEVNDGEYKVMGMAPYGRPLYIDKVKKLVRRFPDGSFQMRMKYFSYHKSADKAYGDEFINLFGKPRPRDLHFFTKKSGYPKYFGDKPGDYEKVCKQNQFYADIAASIQAFTEETILKFAKTVKEKTGKENLCVAGGVGLNSVANGRLLREGPFKNIFIQPAAGDDGGAMGAALYAHHGLLEKKRKFVMKDAYFGKGFTRAEIVRFLKTKHIPYKQMTEGKLFAFLSKEIADGKVIGFFQGRAEWGPRALGNRSILADPRKEEMKEIVNTKIKFREPYRPFAPVVLSEKAAEYFDVEEVEHENLTNYMLGVFPVKREKRKVIPAVTHVDGSGRLQIVSRKQNARYYDLIKAFGDLTGVYVLMNTSFNLRGEPVVNSPENALNTFRKSELDYLVLENYVVRKEDLENI
ncbi:MAG: carbamoyltransferase [Candidatus Levybacteria bacterium]|nr:carbamoyltransferase [Candidatus Levybacteria bacterium]